MPGRHKKILLKESIMTGKSSTGLDANLASLLCYLCTFVTGIIFLLIEKENKDVRFHAWHAIMFGLAIIVVSIGVTVLGKIVLAMSFWLASAFSLVSLVVNLGFFALWIVLMVKAYQGSVLDLPVITDMARKQANK